MNPIEVGLTSVLSGLGISGLDLAGTTLTGGGASVVADAISKMGLQNATISYSFVQNYGQYHKDLKPDNEYNAGEHDYNYKTDDLGRLDKAGPDELKPKVHEGRLSHNSNTPGKEAGDHAGHLFGDHFGGSPELNNLVSQSSKVNLGEYKKIENAWAKALEQGKQVIAEIKVNYNGTSPRPASFEVNWSV